ncbi:MAG: PAS domain S-box protein [Bacteroidota bacterium]|nr:MAG: PAS domain-containing sensor histidine kinase [Bacteroidota bacterium]
MAVEQKDSILSQDTFRQIFQNSAEGIIIVNEEGRIFLANPVAEKMFGYEPGELVNMHLGKLLPERFRARHAVYREQFFQDPRPRRMGVGRDLLAARKDGTEFPVEVSLSSVTIDGHSLVIAFIIDITLRKKSEEALRKSEEQLIIYAAELERKVKSRTEALDKTIRELEKLNKDLEEQIQERRRAEEEAKKALQREREVNELKTKFVSMASHEFRTPLSSVLSSASLIRKYRDKGDLSRIDKHIDRIKSSVNHLTNILNDFLSLGKLEEGKVEVLSEEIDVEEIFEDIVEELRLTLKPGQEIKISCEGSKRRIQSDPKVLRNITFNLVSNASKYSDEGKTIYLGLTFDPDRLRISVRDEGVGIPEDEAKHIFERFYRASNVSNIQGTGLGLNIVKRYVGLLNGTIDFSSEFGKGSTFTVTLPC